MTSIWEEFRDRVSAETKGEDKQVDLLEESDQPENRETETELATDDQARHSAIDRSEIQRPSFDNDVESAPSNNDGLVTKDD